jgi:hypothetical protein
VASIRVAVKDEARRLAAVHDAHVLTGDHHIPPTVIVRLQRMLGASDQPVEVLRWAWRSQLATYVDSGNPIDELATIYLHAALLDLQHGGPKGDSTDSI